MWNYLKAVQRDRVEASQGSGLPPVLLRINWGMIELGQEWTTSVRWRTTPGFVMVCQGLHSGGMQRTFSHLFSSAWLSTKECHLVGPKKGTFPAMVLAVWNISPLQIGLAPTLLAFDEALNIRSCHWAWRSGQSIQESWVNDCSDFFLPCFWFIYL